MTSAQERDRTLGNTSVLHLTAQGRKTSRPRRVELWFVYEQRAVELLSHVASHWYRNLKADPEVQVHADDHAWAGRAEVLDDAQIPVIMDRFQAKYGEAAVRQWYRGSGRVAVRVVFDSA